MTAEQFDDSPPSKTRLKAEADAAQEIGRQLVDLPKDKLKKLPLEEALLDAIAEAKRITSNGAIRRQMQYIGRLMRDIDLAPIVEQLQKWEGKHQEENARFHHMERWRTRLLEDARVLELFIAEFPRTDVQQMRTLIRNAQKEAAANKPPKSSRELFKMIREVMEQTAGVGSDEDAE
ncbi:ribosome-associated protein [Methylophilus rhizosphaerae]|uniref:Dual-action ribosomal maturation protein DarP n=1 Tax=Methylophilus rhizosphaerae TaxID=492660 RepID=A0A1G8ZWQ3_9PROT|nr:ribosome biogenesis factor YjgA [Methylophilus rhizosphaerae]SDK19569.1 ribosome-associated protein [Methylophilus rhizosphaerae]